MSLHARNYTLSGPWPSGMLDMELLDCGLLFYDFPFRPPLGPRGLMAFPRFWF